MKEFEMKLADEEEERSDNTWKWQIKSAEGRKRSCRNTTKVSIMLRQSMEEEERKMNLGEEEEGKERRWT